MYGVEREVFLRHICKGRTEHSTKAAIVFVSKIGVGLIVEHHEACWLAVASVVVIKHVESACKLLLEVSLLGRILATIHLCLIKDKMHTARHLVHELEHSLFLRMNRSKEAVLRHVLPLHGRADSFWHSCSEIAKALSISMRLSAKRCGSERVLPPLLYPILSSLATLLGITLCLQLLIERLTDETMGNIRHRRQGLVVQHITMPFRIKLEVLELAEDLLACRCHHCWLASHSEPFLTYHLRSSFPD